MRSNMSARTTTEAPLGLRERKKQQTRAHIAEAARGLFAELLHGSGLFGRRPKA